MAKTSGIRKAQKGKAKHGNKRLTGDSTFRDSEAVKRSRKASRRMVVSYREPVAVERTIPTREPGELHVDAIEPPHAVEPIVKDGRDACEHMTRYGHIQHENHSGRILDSHDKRRRPSEVTMLAGR